MSFGMVEYGPNCDYIRKTFNLDASTSIYQIVNVITDAYRELLDKQTSGEPEQSKKEEETCQKTRSKTTKKNPSSKSKVEM